MSVSPPTGVARCPHGDPCGFRVKVRVRVIAEALHMLAESGVAYCGPATVRAKLRTMSDDSYSFPWVKVPSESETVTLGRAHLPGVVSDGRVFDCRAGAAIYAAMMERGS